MSTPSTRQDYVKSTTTLNEPPLRPPGRDRKKSLWSGPSPAGPLRDSVLKLNPRTLVKNPVMFVVEVGAVLTTIALVWNTVHGVPGFGFGMQITLWLWFTVLFANFAEAMAEGRGKAQAETLRKARAETMARRITPRGNSETVAGSQLRAGDVVVVEAGEFIPATAKSSPVWLPWMNLQSQVNPRLSFVSPAATARL